MSDHFYIHDRLPHLTVLLSYREAPASVRRGARRPQTDPRGELDERERVAYDALRSWRGATAKQNGIPAYLVATNRQLARMVSVRADSLAALKAIEGFGEQKAELYGRDMLAIIAGHLAGGQDREDGGPLAEDGAQVQSEPKESGADTEERPS